MIQAVAYVNVIDIQVRIIILVQVVLTLAVMEVFGVGLKRTLILEFE